jgi:GDP/UDP-N,N'-diacetylbacillosamine 2-epimerase (hydrolysing)
MRIILVTGTRADFGLWLPIIREARGRDGWQTELLVTAMHLDPRFGDTVREVRASGARVVAEVPCTPEGDSLAEMAAALGQAVQGMTPVLAAERPDWLLVLGDRGEQAAAALVALHLGLPVAHLHGGEVTAGAVDDTLRDLVSRVAHLHLVATTEASRRLVAMGEEPWRIHQVGAPGLDALSEEASGDLVTLRRRHELGVGPYLLLAQHPETVGGRDAAADLAASVEACRRLGLPLLAVYPNADAGGRAMITVLESARAAGILRLVESLPRPEFATLLAGAAALVGNSSSGLIEAPLLRVPAVNVGERQAGRTRGDNVLDVPPQADAIEEALRTATTPAFRDTLSGHSPYGDGRAAPRILDLLAATPRDARLLQKRVGVGAGDHR